jgi:hypothetical protein
MNSLRASGSIGTDDTGLEGRLLVFWVGVEADDEWGSAVFVSSGLSCGSIGVGEGE